MCYKYFSCDVSSISCQVQLNNFWWNVNAVQQCIKNLLLCYFICCLWWNHNCSKCTFWINCIKLHHLLSLLCITPVFEPHCRENIILLNASNKGKYQSEHLLGLIGAFVIHFLEIIIAKLSTWKHSYSSQSLHLGRLDWAIPGRNSMML